MKLNQQTGMHIALTAVLAESPASGPIAARRPAWSAARTGSASRRRSIATRALAELARLYVRAFAPATDRDFAYWAGLPLRDVRAGLESISKEIEEVRVGDETMLAPLGGLPRLPATGQVRMLGNFDTYLLGWKDRGFSVASEHAQHVKEGGGGWIRPVILEDGIVVGGWRSVAEGRQAGDHPQPAECRTRAATLEDRRRGRRYRALRGH